MVSTRKSPFIAPYAPKKKTMARPRTGTQDSNDDTTNQPQPGTSTDTTMPPPAAVPEATPTNSLGFVIGAPAPPVAVGQELRTLEELIKVITDDLSMVQVNAHKTALEWLADGLAYLGLDVKRMRLHIAKKLHDANLDISKNVYVAIAIGLTRGNNIDSMQKSMRSEVKTVVQNTVAAIGIVSKPGANPEAITFSRLMSCFPEASVMVSTIMKSKGPVPDVLEGFPHCMRFIFFSSMIPNNSTESISAEKIDHIRKAYIMHQALVTLQLDKKVRTITVPLLDRQKTFAMTGIQKSPLTNARRIALIMDPQYGLFTQGGELVPSIIYYSTKYNSYFQQ